MVVNVLSILYGTYLAYFLNVINIIYLAEYIIPPPKDVFYYHKTRTLEFTTLDTGPEQYCARVDVHDGLDWDLYEPCAPTEGGSIRIADEWLVDMIQMAHCLDRRPKICSDNVTAIIGEFSTDWTLIHGWLPSKNKTFVWHLCNVGPTSKTSGRRCTNAIQMFCVY